MNENDTYAEASYQGQPIDAGTEPGAAINATENSSQADSVSTESSTPREASNSSAKAQDQAEAIQAKIDYEKSYKELEKKYTRDRQNFAKYEKENKTYAEQVKLMQQFEQKLSQHPELVQQLQQAFSGQKQLEPNLANDPLYKHLEPTLGKISQLEKVLNQFQAKEQETQANSLLDRAEAQAKTMFKDAFGKDMGKEELGKLYQWMADNNIADGAMAFRNAFWDEYSSAVKQNTLTSQQAKKGLGTTKLNGVNSNIAKAKTDGKMTIRQAWKAAKAELGVE